MGSSPTARTICFRLRYSAMSVVALAKRMLRRNEVKASLMKYVYILQSENQRDRFYVGSTVDLDRRLDEHNSGNSVHTNKYRPWKMKTYVAFDDHGRAGAFEAFLKTGNGRIFAKKRL